MQKTSRQSYKIQIKIPHYTGFKLNQGPNNLAQDLHNSVKQSAVWFLPLVCILVLEELVS